VGPRNIRVLACATVRSSGFAGGRIVNIAAAESSVRRAVGQAEAQAGVTAGEVIVTGQFEGLATQIFAAKTGPGEATLMKEDAAAISAALEERCLAAQRKLLHMFTLSEAENEMLLPGAAPLPQEEVDVVAVTMPLKGARQIAACFSRSMLMARGYVAGPIATALAVTDPLERLAGVLVIDLGAETTGYALFRQGVPVAAECIGLGGQHITDQIARAFAWRKFEAERAKIRYGSVYDGLQADIDLPVLHGESEEPVSKFALNHLIRSSASQVFHAINERLKCNGYSVPLGGIVLAGGGSQLPGIRELASHLLGAEVKTAKPAALNGLSAGNALAAVVGGCLYASRHQPPDEMRYAPGIVSQDSSYASRIGQWLRASF
jgi:cell division protein FtsA